MFTYYNLKCSTFGLLLFFSILNISVATLASGIKKIEPLTDLKLITGKTINLIENKKIKMIAFIALGTKCPLGRKYAPIVNQMEDDKLFGQVGAKIVYLAVGAHDTKASVKKEILDFNIRSMVIYDSSQSLSKKLGLTTTTEVVLVNLLTSEVAYQGAIDDGINFEATKKPKNHYLRDAILATSKGITPTITRTEAFGCAITY